MIEVNEYELKMTNLSCSEEFPTFSLIVLTCLNSISGHITVCGNLLVLMAIFRTPSLREASYVFIGSLAAADLTIGLVMTPRYAAIVGQSITDAGHPLNVAEHYLWIHTVITTTFNLAGISVEKYIAVIHPLHYPLVVTTRRTIVAVIAIWCLSVLFMCAQAFINKSHDIETYWIAHFAIAIAIPLAINSFVYSIRMRDFRTAIRRMCSSSNYSNDIKIVHVIAR